MKTYTFDTIQAIQDFQFLTDSTGLLLDSGGRLYSFDKSAVQAIPTPASFTVTHFYFTQSGHGAVAGNANSPALRPQEGSLGASGVGLAFLAALLLKNKVLPARPKLPAGLLGLALAAVLLASCSRNWQQYAAPDPASRFTTIISSQQLHKSSFHHYQGNKGQKSFIAITATNGREWNTQEVPTNFYVTALTAIGQNFLVGTYANDQAGTNPIHGDGDIWIYGNDPAYTPLLANNTPQQPYRISPHRGLNGFASYPQDSVVFAFGSERMPTFPRNEVSVTNGNIYALPTSLSPNFTLTDAPDSAAVHSLSKSGAGEVWVTLEDRTMRVVAGKTQYFPLPAKKLFRLKAGAWVHLNPGSRHSFEQVEFVPGTSRGYVTTATGEVLATPDNGNSWHPTGLQNVRLMHARNKHIGFLQGKNHLVVD